MDGLESLFQNTSTEDVFQRSVGIVCEVGFYTLEDFGGKTIVSRQEHLRSDALGVELPAKLLRRLVEIQRPLRALHEANGTMIFGVEDFTLEVGDVSLGEQQRLCANIS